jgi:hypothetical protein
MVSYFAVLHYAVRQLYGHADLGARVEPTARAAGPGHRGERTTDFRALAFR